MNAPNPERERRAAALSEAYRQGGVGTQYRAKTFKGYIIENEAQQKAMKTLKKYLTTAMNDAWGDDQRRWLLLQGNTGTGKTHLLAASMRAIILSGRRMHRCCYREGGELVRLLKSGAFGKESQVSRPLHQVVHALFGGMDLALIDDLWVTPPKTEYDKEVLFSFFNTLYGSGQPLVMVSNLPLAKWPVGQREMSRIKERTTVVEMMWADHRQGGLI